MDLKVLLVLAMDLTELMLIVLLKMGVLSQITASFGTEEVSNHALMHLLVCARKFVLHDKLVKMEYGQGNIYHQWVIFLVRPLA